MEVMKKLRCLNEENENFKYKVQDITNFRVPKRGSATIRWKGSMIRGNTVFVKNCGYF